MDRRYLDGRAKLRVLEQWFDLLAELRWQPPGARGGRGEPDADMVPWCIRLNRLPGVCTLQSCAGHKDGRHLSSGHVWLWLDRASSATFDAHAPELACRSPLIEDVSRRYTADGQEIVVVTFQGNERGSLAASMELVCSFVERIASATSCSARPLP